MGEECLPCKREVKPMLFYVGSFLAQQVGIFGKHWPFILRKNLSNLDQVLALFAPLQVSKSLKTLEQQTSRRLYSGIVFQISEFETSLVYTVEFYGS